MDITERRGNEIRTTKIFAAVFSKKASVSLKRLAILRSINNYSNGKMTFREILKAVQSVEGFEDYSSQKLAYDLRILKANKLIDQMLEGTYTITVYGYYLLDVFDGIAHRFGVTRVREKPGIAGEVTGNIVVKEFDYVLLGEELSENPIFRKKLSFEGNKYCLEWKDKSEDFRSEIEISPDGSFAIRILLYGVPFVRKGDFIEDMSKNEEWYNMAKGMVYTIVYYIQRTVNKLWKDANVVIPLKPDAYPLNIFGEGEPIEKSSG